MIAALGTVMSGVCLIYYGTQSARDELEAGLTAEQRATMRWRPARELLTRSAPANAPAVLVADGVLLERHGELLDLPGRVAIVAADATAGRVLGRRADVTLANVRDDVVRASLLEAACRLAASRSEADALHRALARDDDELGELSRVAGALMLERDRTALSTLIVRFGKRARPRATVAACCYSRATTRMRAGDSAPSSSSSTRLPALSIPTVSFPVGVKSMVGYAAYSREPVVVADAESLPPGSPFEANAEFERRYGYPARSMMALPMLTQRDEVLGVVFFINRKSDPHISIMAHEDADRYIVPFSDRQVRARAFAREHGRGLDRECATLRRD